ncbi:MAG: ATP-binding protein [bacterium]|jgi:MinD superfamily P-loop ATPase
MKKIAVISGKGGTGKTTVAASLAQIVQDKMIADCDVDAPNLHILLPGELMAEAEYMGAKEAVLDSNACVGCGRCRDVCRFGAISPEFTVIARNCEGCGACVVACPQGALQLKDVRNGKTYVKKTGQGVFAYARLDCGAEGSGKLVTAVRENAEKYRKDEDWLLIDGAPGVGCVVIASITGCDAVLVVTEPTLSGQSDLERVLGVADFFRIPAYVCINKYDLNPEVGETIETFCREWGYAVLGKIPFDPGVVEALRHFRTPLETGGPAGAEIKKISAKLLEAIDGKEKMR